MRRLAEGHIHNKQRTHEYGLQPKNVMFMNCWGVAPGYGEKKAFGQIKTRNIKTHASGYDGADSPSHLKHQSP